MEDHGSGLPERLARLVDKGLSTEAALRLQKAFGGCTVYLPKGVAEEHLLVETLGIEAAQQLCKIAGGQYFYVPIRRWRRDVRDERIRRELAAKVPVREICQRYCCSERLVSNVGGTAAQAPAGK